MPVERSNRHSRLFELAIEERQRKTLQLLQKMMDTLKRSEKAVQRSHELMDGFTTRNERQRKQQH